MYSVYLIRSLKFSNQIYIGYTNNLEKRLSCHNTGGSIYTAKYRPWEVIVSMDFKDEQKAVQFEKYLKSQSGRAFITKRFL